MLEKTSQLEFIRRRSLKSRVPNAALGGNAIGTSGTVSGKFFV